MVVVGDYFLNVKLAGVPIVTDMRGLEYLNIFMGLDRLVPYLNIRVQDTAGVLTQLAPGDILTSLLSVGFQSILDREYKEFDFRIVKRVPEGDWASSVFKAFAVLNLPGLFASRCRAFENMYWEEIFAQIAKEVGATQVELSPGLNFKVSLVQPCKSNAWLLNYLEDRLLDCFIYFVLKGKDVALRVVSLSWLFRQPVKKKFSLGDRMFQDAYALREYEFVEDAGVLSLLGVKGQEVLYFDYEKGSWELQTYSPEDYLSLSSYLLVDKSEKDYSFCCPGRTNDVFDVKRVGEGKFSKKLLNMSHAWVSVDPVFDVIPGDIVEVECLQGLLQEKPMIWRMSGKWLVKRVIYQFGVSAAMRMLLCRAGIETDDETTSLLKGRRV